MQSIISLGAGVQSSTLALMADKGLFPKYKINCAIFADTQAEPKAVSEWLDWLEYQLSFPVYRVSAGNLREESLIMRKSAKTGYVYLRTLIPMFVKNNDGSKGKLIRKCTTDFKLKCIWKKQRELIGRQRLNAWRREYRLICNGSHKNERKAEKHDLCNVNGRLLRPIIRQLIGISYDEVERMRSSRIPFIHNQYPLVDLKMTRQDCLDWFKSQGFKRQVADWYQDPESQVFKYGIREFDAVPPRSACTFCPFHSDKEWLDLEREIVRRNLLKWLHLSDISSVSTKSISGWMERFFFTHLASQLMKLISESLTSIFTVRIAWARAESR